MLFKSRLKDIFVITLVAFGGYFGNWVGFLVLGTQLQGFLGGLVVGIISNVFNHVTNRPAFFLNLPGLILLVPGSVGFRGINLLFEQDGINAINTSFMMLTQAFALVAGFFLANLFSKPRNSL